MSLRGLVISETTGLQFSDSGSVTPLHVVTWAHRRLPWPNIGVCEGTTSRLHLPPWDSVAASEPASGVPTVGYLKLLGLKERKKGAELMGLCVHNG